MGIKGRKTGTFVRSHMLLHVGFVIQPILVRTYHISGFHLGIRLRSIQPQWLSGLARRQIQVDDH